MKKQKYTFEDFLGVLCICGMIYPFTLFVVKPFIWEFSLPLFIKLALVLGIQNFLGILLSILYVKYLFRIFNRPPFTEKELDIEEKNTEYFKMACAVMSAHTFFFIEKEEKLFPILKTLLTYYQFFIIAGLFTLFFLILYTLITAVEKILKIYYLPSDFYKEDVYALLVISIPSWIVCILVLGFNYVHYGALASLGILSLGSTLAYFIILRPKKYFENQ